MFKIRLIAVITLLVWAGLAASAQEQDFSGISNVLERVVSTTSSLDQLLDTKVAELERQITVTRNELREEERSYEKQLEALKTRLNRLRYDC